MTDPHDLIRRLVSSLLNEVDWTEDAKLRVDPVLENARAYLATGGWIPCSDRMPPDETTVLIQQRDGSIHVAELRWDHPTFEETYSAYRYWDNPYDDGRDWEWDSVIRWQPVNPPPPPGAAP